MAGGGLIQSIRVQATSDGDNTIIAAPGATKTIVVIGYTLTGQTAAGTALLRSGVGGLIHADLAFGLGASAGGTASYSGTRDAPAFRCEKNAALNCNNSTGLDTKGMVVYYIDED